MTQKFVEFTSSDNFDIDQVYDQKRRTDPKKYQKFCNEDYDLLGRNMTPGQFESIVNDTKYQKNLKSAQSCLNR